MQTLKKQMWFCIENKIHIQDNSKMFKIGRTIIVKYTTVIYFEGWLATSYTSDTKTVLAMDFFFFFHRVYHSDLVIQLWVIFFFQETNFLCYVQSKQSQINKTKQAKKINKKSTKPLHLFS